MTVTYGFFDSVSSDRLYNAKQMGSIFDGLILDGIYPNYEDALEVLQDSPASMDVTVGLGRAWFDSTWTYNDALLTLTVATADALLDRIDVLYLEVNEDVATRANKFDILTGTPASTPTAPTLTNTSTVHQYAIAHIYVGAGVTTIVQANITDQRGSANTPYVELVTLSEDLQAQIYDIVGDQNDPLIDLLELKAHDHTTDTPQIPTAGIENSAVTSTKLGTSAVTNTKLGPDAVTGSKIADGAVDTEHLAASAVTNAKIEDGAVDYLAIANNTLNKNHLGNEIPAIVKRFGGSATDWNTAGTSGYSVGEVRMQMGVFTAAFSTAVRIIYSPSFSNDPLLFFTFWDGNIDSYQISFQAGESYAKEFIFTHFTTSETATVHWLAIGPE